MMVERDTVLLMYFVEVAGGDLSKKEVIKTIEKDLACALKKYDAKIHEIKELYGHYDLYFSVEHPKRRRNSGYLFVEEMIAKKLRETNRVYNITLLRTIGDKHE